MKRFYSLGDNKIIDIFQFFINYSVHVLRSPITKHTQLVLKKTRNKTSKSSKCFFLHISGYLLVSLWLMLILWFSIMDSNTILLSMLVNMHSQYSLYNGENIIFPGFTATNRTEFWHWLRFYVSQVVFRHTCSAKKYLY